MVNPSCLEDRDDTNKSPDSVTVWKKDGKEPEGDVLKVRESLKSQHKKPSERT